MEEPVTELNELIAANLRHAIDRIETALKNGAVAGAEFLLKGELSNKQAQLSEVRQRQDNFDKEKKEEKTRESSEIAYLVAKETRLNDQEKEEYTHFLSKEYFKKSDLMELEGFYTHSWDKLSGDGKAQMSHRVAEGIKRGEYTFDELPANVKKREADRLQAYGIDVSPESKGRDNPEKTSQYIEKSGSRSEPDSSKEIKPERKKPQEKKTEKDATTQSLAFESGTVNPFDLPQSGGSSGRSI